MFRPANGKSSDDPSAKHQLWYENKTKVENLYVDVRGSKSNKKIPLGFEPRLETVKSKSLADFDLVEQIFTIQSRVKDAILTVISDNPKIEWSKPVKPSVPKMPKPKPLTKKQTR